MVLFDGSEAACYNKPSVMPEREKTDRRSIIRMKKIYKPGTAALLMLILSLTCFAAAEGMFTQIPEVLRPGKTERFVYTAAYDGDADIILCDEKGNEWSVMTAQKVRNGSNSLIWDGMLSDGTYPTEGTYTLCVLAGPEKITSVLRVGALAPRIDGVEIYVSEDTGLVSFRAECSAEGKLTVVTDVDDEKQTVCEIRAHEGLNTFSWDGTFSGRHISEGEHMLQMCLTDDTGFSGTKQNRSVYYPYIADTQETEATEKAQSHTVIPSRQTTAASEDNYWTMTLGELDEEHIWQILMQPLTVLDGNQTDVYKLRATPDKSTSKDNVIGEVTYASQGLHILETLDNGWTKVEVYNSSYGPNCKSRRGYGVTNDLLTGYVETGKLKTITPYDRIGLVIDKLNQTMYIFEDGKLTGTLLVSTGLNNKTQSWNETPSGEYIMISKMGGFAAGNLWCAYGMRVNGGCAIHEVPYIGNENTPAADRDYSANVKLLGSKASHGCIRVQKASNAAGQNIKWLWNNMKVGTKVLIWEDSGRYLEYPDDSLELYYNPNGGQYYHEAQYCTGVKDRYLPLTAFTYGELDSGAFANLKPCSNCCHIKRKAEIDALNKENGF